MKNLKVLTTLVFVLLAAQTAFAQIRVGVETGAVFSGYNDVRVPSSGSPLSLSRELKGNPFFFFRFNASYTLKSRHTFSVLIAPLQTTYKGSVDRDINFGGSVFAADTDLKATYKFNSYRLTYRYDIVKRPRIEFGLGLTAKIRDAKIALRSSDEFDEKVNLGFVPIINFRLAWHCTDKIGLLFQGDALAAPQGRAEDVLLAGTYRFSDKLQMHLGYRILEGGGDAKTVYTFSNFNYAAVGITYTF